MKTQRWLHGFLGFYLLGLTGTQRDYGRGLAGRLARSGSGETLGDTLYPALVRTERQGLIAAPKEPFVAGPPRKYCETTAKGREVFRELIETWERFKAAVETTVDGKVIPREVIVRQATIRGDEVAGREGACRNEPIGREGDWR